MRVNVYAEEMSERIEIISKEIEGRTFTGLRFYLELPVTVPCPQCGEDPLRGRYDCGRCDSKRVIQVQGPFMHHPGDDDSGAVTFWGKRDLRGMLQKAMAMLDEHYGETDADHA